MMMVKKRMRRELRVNDDLLSRYLNPRRLSALASGMPLPNAADFVSRLLRRVNFVGQPQLPRMQKQKALPARQGAKASRFSLFCLISIE